MFCQGIRMGQQYSSLELISDPEFWIQYIEHKKASFPDNPRIPRYEKLLKKKSFIELMSQICEGKYVFSIPEKKLVSKTKVGKKRTVYSFGEQEMMALRIIAYSLYHYDPYLSDCLYSFRSSHIVKEAILRIRYTSVKKRCYGLKIDIHNYFNSIPVDRFLPMLKNVLQDDPVYSLIEGILCQRQVLFRDEVIEENKGVMAGIPLSPFCANLYLSDMDKFFETQNCTYLRYADDILILSDSSETIVDLKCMLEKWIRDKELKLNPKKVKMFNPGDPIEFLGFSISDGDIDISDISVYKLKRRIRRSARAIRRWMLKNNAPLEGTLKALIRRYNRKFYGYEESEISWGRWFFPIITTDRSLHEIDLYFQDWLRFVGTGRHTKKNYDTVPYEIMKRCGYVPLVSEYHRRKDNINNQKVESRTD